MLRARIIDIHEALIRRIAFMANAVAGVKAKGFFYNSVLRVAVS